MVGGSSISVYGVYLGDQNGHSQFRLCNSDGETVVHKHSVANTIKTGYKVALTLTGVKVLQVHDPDSVICGTGTVTAVKGGLGDISFEQNKRLSMAFFFNRNLDRPPEKRGVAMNRVVAGGSHVQFEAIPEQYNGEVRYRAVRVSLLSKDEAKASAVSLPKLLRDQRGIIVKIFSGCNSLLIWSKELGYVYAPYSCFNRGKEHNLRVGQWLEFDVVEQMQIEGCHWVMINKSRTFEGPLMCRTRARRRYLVYLQTIDGTAVVTNVFGNEGLLWSNDLGRIYVGEQITAGWCKEEFVAGYHVTFDAERSTDPDYEDIGWQATKIKRSPATLLQNCIQQCMAQLTAITEPFCGVLHNEQFGKISFTWMDFHALVTNDNEFRAAINEHKYFDVRFVPNFKHSEVEWSAVYVKPAVEERQADFVASISELDAAICHEVQMPQQVEQHEASDDSFMTELEKQLQQVEFGLDFIGTSSTLGTNSLVHSEQLNNDSNQDSTEISSRSCSSGYDADLDETGVKQDLNQTSDQEQHQHEMMVVQVCASDPVALQDLNQSAGTESDFTTSVQGQIEPQSTDAECQTEKLNELALFRLICDTPALFSVMLKSHKDQILVMRQIVKHKFVPDYQSAMVESESTSSLGLRNVTCQTASTPEAELLDRLINDQEIFDLLVEIDQNLIMSFL